MKKISLYFFIWIGTISFAAAQKAGDNLYDNSFLHQINFEAPNLEQIIPHFPGSYVDPVKMAIDGFVVDSIFIRRKGFTSAEFNDTNPPFKIDIDNFIADQEYDGIDKFNLHNHYYDTSYQRNALAYALYRRAGVAAPRTSFAEVYINGKFIDIYTITEEIDKTFLKQNFASNNGSLYKGVEYPANSVVVQTGTIDAYDDFINNASPNNISSIVDLHNFFRVLAVDLIINEEDAYAGGSHNFYMYHEPESEKLHLITWDHNFAFSTRFIDTKFLYPGRSLENSIITDPAIKPLYLQTMCDLLSYLLEGEYIVDLAMHNYNILNKNVNNLNIPSPDPIINLLASQKQWFRDKLNEEGFSNCDSLVLPFNIGDIVINELASKNDINGILEPNGETGDWIELFNNTSSNINIDQRFYISDDKDFPKKWHFEKEVVVQANGYLIIWADRDLNQEGIHTNFKLNSSEGDLLFTYEDLTELQNINYKEQELNLGYARVPNGTGNFVVQRSTFNVNNEKILSLYENSADNTDMIYPNPTNRFINIENLNLNQDAIIYIINILGQKVLTTHAKKEIDLCNLAAGNYILLINDNNQSMSFRFLIN